MSEYCDIFPEDPTCAVEEEEVVVEDEEEVVIDDEETADAEGDDEEADAEGDMDEMKEEMEEEMMEKMEKMDWDMTPSQMWMKAGELMQFASIDPFMGQITYLMVAIGVSTHTALDLFRYRQADSDAAKDYYKNSRTGPDSDWSATGEFEGTNWYKIGDLLMKYTNLAVFGVAAITQILAGLGIAPGINMLVWIWGVGVVVGLANFVGGLFKFLGYETGYSNREETTTGVFNLLMADGIKAAMIEDTVMETSVALALYMQMENWHWAAWDALPQEDKETQLEELMAEIEEWDAEKMAEMESEMKSEKKGKKEKKSEEADEEDVEEEIEEDAEEVAEEAEEEE